MLNFDLIVEVARYLGLNKPYDIRIKSKRHDWAAGFCEQHTRKGKIVKHIVTVYIPTAMDSEYTLESVIAHELIHAWQAEQGYLTEGNYHGVEFQEMSEDITDTFGIANIFCEATDVD